MDGLAKAAAAFRAAIEQAPSDRLTIGLQWFLGAPLAMRMTCLDDLGIVEIGRIFFDDSLNKDWIDVLLQHEGTIIVTLFSHRASSEPSVISSRISTGIFSTPAPPI